MKKNKKYIYLIKDETESCYKIGVAKSPQKRLETFKTANSNDIQLKKIYQTDIAHKIEKALHNQFSSLNIKGEWFNLDLKDETEFLYYCEKIENQLKYLENNKI